MARIPKTPKVVVSIPLDPATHALIIALAEQRDQPIARVVRRLVDAGIAAEGLTVTPVAATQDPAPSDVKDAEVADPKPARARKSTPFHGDDRF